MADNSKGEMTIQEVAESLKRYKEVKAIAMEGEKEMSEKLLQMLKKSGSKGVTSDDGWRFTRSIRTVFKVLKGKEDEAREWAEKHNALKIDTAKVYQLSRRVLTVLPGFERAETEYISTKSPTGQQDDD